MKKSSLFFLKTLLLWLFLALAIGSHAQEVDQNGVRKGVVKVKFQPTMTTTLSTMKVNTRKSVLTTGITTFDKVANSVQATKMKRLFPFNPNPKYEAKLRKHGLHLWYVVEIDEKQDPTAVAKLFSQLPEVSIAEYQMDAVLIPHTVKPYVPTPQPKSTMPFNDILLPNQWHYSNTGQTGYADGADINLFKAWEMLGMAGKGNVVVAVIDNGVDVTHEDLKANIWVNEMEKPGTDKDDDGNNYVDDINGFDFIANRGMNMVSNDHGTHVAGTIAAVNNNGIGVSGIAGGTGKNDGVKIMSLRAIEGAADIELAFIYAADNGAVICQNSWGWGSPDYFAQSVLDGIDYFIAEAGDYEGSPMKGGIVIFASGNDDKTGNFWPGCYEKVLTVASLGPDWTRAYYSNWGDWVNVAAPGGDYQKGTVNGILSTTNNGRYGYLQGTSMACPHVSGIAALMVSSAKNRVYNNELWTRLTTGVRYIDNINPNYAGKLGTGAVDAVLVCQPNNGIAPNKITNLAVDNIEQEFAELSWNVPVDEDDQFPVGFYIYHSRTSLDAGNITTIEPIYIKNNSVAGSPISYTLENLFGNTRYYIAIQSVDRWGNRSELSNILDVVTQTGPKIVTSASQLTINISDASVSAKDSVILNIANQAVGALRWSYSIRNKSTVLSTLSMPIGLEPVISESASAITLGMSPITYGASEPITVTPAEIDVFTPFAKNYSKTTSAPSEYRGEMRFDIPNSSATKFIVSEESGFNLTHINFYVSHLKSSGNIIIQVIEGKDLKSKNLIYEQAYSGSSDIVKDKVSLVLDEHIYFKKGSEFWILIHVPAGNQYPLAITTEKLPEYSDRCFYSSDLGATWTPLEKVLANSTYVWWVEADSKTAHPGSFITLNPASGRIVGNSNADVNVVADASKVINGTYKASLVLHSNDVDSPETRVEVEVKVAGNKPNLAHADIVNFEQVFIGKDRQANIVLVNTGYGLIKNLTYTLEGPQAAAFKIDSKPTSVAARNTGTVKVTYKPTATGNSNAKLKITNGTYTYYVQLFGSAAEPAKIKLTPISQTIPALTIGDTPTATIRVENIGGYPLKYFIPGFDKQNISDNWPDDYHKYGYVVSSTDPNVGPNPIPYVWTDISDTGMDISYDLLVEKVDYFKSVPIGFKFPFYDKQFDSLHIARFGFVSFDSSIKPVNAPTMNNTTAPKSFISLFGARVYPDYKNSNGRIYFQSFSDYVVVQYDNIQFSKGMSNTEFTAQMVLHANGNIRFYYKKMLLDAYNQNYMNILIEDWDKKDGIMLKGYNVGDFLLTAGMAIGFDYPGLNIVTDITNASGVLAPGAHADMTVSFKTDKLPEGITPKYITVISNDIDKPSTNAKVNLDIVAGGVVDYEVEGTTHNFGTMYKTYSYSKTFTIRNTGTKTLTINAVNYATGGMFALSGSTVVNPGTQQHYTITANTSSLGTLSDVISVTLSNGDVVNINVNGEVLESPEATADLTLLSETLSANTTSSHPYSITNTGLSDLVVSIESSALWAKFVETDGKPIVNHSYRDTRHNGHEPTYTWIDIRETGVRFPYDITSNDSDVRWHELASLPFPVTFFGQTYSSLLISENGLISLTGHKPDMSWGTTKLPIPDMGGYIMPMLSRGDFDIQKSEKEHGLFYKLESDKIIISWERFYNYTGATEPISFQVVLYKEGTIKFQYKKNSEVERHSDASFVALQKPGTGEVIQMSRFRLLDHGVNLAYLLTPTASYSIAPGQQLNGNIIFDARTHSGVFKAPLYIVSNDPANSTLEKPLKLTVPGVASVKTPTEVNIGENEAIRTANNSWKEYTDLFVIKNDGDVPFNIVWAKMTGFVNLHYLVQKMWYTSSNGTGWTSIETIYNMPWPPRPIDTLKHWLLPGDSLVTQISFTPRTAGDFSANVIMTTDNSDIGDIIIPFKGKAYNSPVMGVDLTPISVRMTKPTDIETKTVDFNNNGGGYELSYKAYIDYKRVKPTSTKSAALPTESFNVSKVPSLLNTHSKDVGIIANSSIATPLSIQRYLKYVEGSGSIGRFGVGVNAGAGQYMPRFATKFTAGPDGFNISDVGTWFAAEKQLKGTVLVEIWTGDNLYEPVVLGSGSAAYNYDAEITKGSIVNVKLDKEVTIYPNESFWVVFTYPLNIESPQGYQFNTPEQCKVDRYFFESVVELPGLSPKYVWFDAAAQLGDFMRLGANWIMYAAETNTNESGFVRILQSDANGALDGKLQIGESRSLELEFYGTYAQPKDQIADLVFASTDTKNPVKRIPLKLYMNDAPNFTVEPQVLQADEGQTTTASFTVEDPDNDTFTLATLAAPDFVQVQLVGSSINLTITPDYGSAGSYVAKFIATDIHNVSRELQVQIEVTHVNRTPISKLGESDIWEYNIAEGSKEYNINELFEDPDGDDLSLTLAVDNVNIAYATELSNSLFTVTPKAEGTTKLTITATDTYGASKEISVQIIVFRINRPPTSILNDVEVWEYNITEGRKEYNINDIIEDSDGDSFTFTLSVDNASIASADKLGEDRFIVTPKVIGSTKLTISAVDVYNATSSIEVYLQVNDCENDIIIQKWNFILLVDNKDGKYKEDGYQWYKYGVAIEGATKQFYSAGTGDNDMLDFTAKYHVRMTAQDGKYVYTCPMTPVQRTDISLKSYPNPVERGATVVLEAQVPDLASSPLEINLYTLNGVLVKTQQSSNNLTNIAMPANPGIYMMKVSNSSVEKTFKLIVK